MKQSIREQVYLALEPPEGATLRQNLVSILIFLLIILNAIVIIIASLEEYRNTHILFLVAFNIFSILVFSVEYVLRLWTCTCNPEYRKPLKGRVKYALTPYALVDLFAVLPYYLPFFIPFDLRFLRVLRLLRIFQILKIARYSSATRMLGRVIKKESEVLVLIAFILGILLILASSLMFAVEKNAQPEVFSSIPAAMWWAIVTLTTVGYGDVTPVTPLGKIVGGCIAIMGIGMFALPAGVLASGFAEEIRKERNAGDPSGTDDTLDRLERLQRLREQGALSEEEFAAQKEKVLNSH